MPLIIGILVPILTQSSFGQPQRNQSNGKSPSSSRVSANQNRSHLFTLDTESSGSSNSSSSSNVNPQKKYPWSIFIYGGTWTDNKYLDIMLGRTDLGDSHVGVIGASRTLWHYSENLLVEGEVNIARHRGEQNHFELNSAMSARWISFPWDSYVNSSFSFGMGTSLATELPEIEEMEADRDASQTLFFLQTEVTFGPPISADSPWETFVRIHHRSGGFGKIIDAQGSNFLTFGIRYRFE